MLTGPVTILHGRSCATISRWPTPPPDRPGHPRRGRGSRAAGIAMIQIDEPALREGLPLRRPTGTSIWTGRSGPSGWRPPASRMRPQIHTHMCYSEFNDISAHRRHGRRRDLHRGGALADGTARRLPRSLPNASAPACTTSTPPRAGHRRDGRSLRTALKAVSGPTALGQSRLRTEDPHGRGHRACGTWLPRRTRCASGSSFRPASVTPLRDS